MAGLFGGNRRLPNIDPRLGADLARERGMGGLLNPAGQPGAPMQAPAKKSGFFGQGGAGRAIAGTIGDVLLQRGGLAPIYAPQMELMQQAQAEAEAQQQERAMRREDMQWEWANKPSTTQPYRTEDNAGNVQELQPDGTFKPIFIDPNDRTYLQDGQLVTVPNVVRLQQQGGGNADPNRKVIGGKTYVRRGNEWFEEGAGSNASGTFRGPFAG